MLSFTFTNSSEQTCTGNIIPSPNRGPRRISGAQRQGTTPEDIGAPGVRSAHAGASHALIAREGPSLTSHSYSQTEWAFNAGALIRAPTPSAIPRPPTGGVASYVTPFPPFPICHPTLWSPRVPELRRGGFSQHSLYAAPCQPHLSRPGTISL